jgi:hypothetical protein
VFRLSAIANIPVRLAVGVAWLCAFVWFGLNAFVHGANVYESATYRDIRAEGPWTKVTGRVDSVRAEFRRDMGLSKEREYVQYSYEFGGRRYAGQTESVRMWAGAGGSDGASPDYRKGGPIDLWVSESRPARSELSEPREPQPAGPQAWRFLGYLALLVLATWIAKRIVFRPLPRAEEVLSAGGLETVREQFEAARRMLDDPEAKPADVALPASIRVERTARGIKVEFPRAGRSTPEVTGIARTGFMGLTFTVVAIRSGFSLIPLAFGLILCGFFLGALRSSFRRCIAEAGPAGLDCRRGYAGFSSRTTIPRLDIDFLEVRPNSSGGPVKGAQTAFEIAVIRGDGKRFVLGENVPGIAAADTLVRRFGQALSLQPEQVLGAAATVRRLLGAAESALGESPARGRR